MLKFLFPLCVRDAREATKGGGENGINRVFPLREGIFSPDEAKTIFHDTALSHSTRVKIKLGTRYDTNNGSIRPMR